MRCPVCQAENQTGQNFCGECGTRLQAVQVREERKVITALFCDLVGSTALGERMDHEDVAHLLLDYQQLCRHQIEAHGGVIEKFIGDAVVGVFGVPAAHEDDPERAVRSALRIVEDIQISDLPIEVRIGINTGEALVRLGTGPDEGFATGDVMNTTARLEAAAPVMGVAVSDATYVATADVVTYGELEPISAKGKADPLKAWRAIKPNSRAAMTDTDGTPFVGRELELSMLVQLFDRSRARSATEFVTIIADPGLGKSRLVRELARHSDAVNELVTWRQGRCLPYGDGISFWALGEIIKAEAGILETDDQATIGTKLEAAVVAEDRDTAAWIKDRLAPLVGLETSSSPPERDEAFGAWRRFVESLAAHGPAVLVIEDLHWADDGFVAFLEDLSERTAGLPLFIVVTARPEIEERHPSWPPGRRSTVFTLSPLNDEELTELVGTTVPGLSAEVAAEIAERAGGSPLFAEQLGAMIRERAMPIAGGSVADAPIPTSVQALISARIDGLPVEPKRVLMEASVVGKSFWSGAISAIGHHEDLLASLAELARREFVRPVMPSSMDGELEYSFWHALVRDVAYAELSKGERAQLHAAAAQWIVDRAGGALGESGEIVLHHLDAARELGRDRGADEAIERIALTAAVDVAMRSDLARAAALLQRSVESQPLDSFDRASRMGDLGRVLAFLGRLGEASEVLREALDLLLTLGHLDRAFDVGDDLGVVLRTLGDRDGDERLTERLRGLIPHDDSPVFVNFEADRALAAAVKADYPRALAAVDRVTDVCSRIGYEVPKKALQALGMAKLATGDRDGERPLREAFERSFAEGNVAAAAGALFNLSAMLASYEPVRAAAILDESIELSAARGAEVVSFEARAGRLAAASDLGRFSVVLDEFPAVLDWAIVHEHQFVRLLALASVGRVDEADGSDRVDLADFVEGVRSSGESFLLSYACTLAWARGEDELALELLTETLSSPAGQTVVYDVAGAATGLGRADLIRQFVSEGPTDTPLQRAGRQLAEGLIAASDGDHGSAHESFRVAAVAFAELGLVPAEIRSLMGAGRSLLALERHEDAAAVLQRARSLSQAIDARACVHHIDLLMRTRGGG